MSSEVLISQILSAIFCNTNIADDRKRKYCQLAVSWNSLTDEERGRILVDVEDLLENKPKQYKLRLAENHSYKPCNMERIGPYLGKPVDIETLCSIGVPIVLSHVEDGYIFIDHPYSW